MNWSIMVAPNYEFEIDDIKSLVNHPEYLRNAAVISKEPHQLVEVDLINWGTVEYNRSTFLRRLQRSPYATIWDYIEPQMGTYRWERGNSGDADVALARLQEVNLSTLIPWGGGRFQWDLKEQSKIERYRSIYRHGPEMASGNPIPLQSTYIDPIKVYKDANGKDIILDGYKRYMAAKAEGLTTLKAWVYLTENDQTLNRTLYMKKALDKNLKVPDNEYSLASLGPSIPLYVPTLSYKDLRKIFYPPIGNQLDAITKSILDGDNADLKDLIVQIQQIKRRFPKV